MLNYSLRYLAICICLPVLIGAVCVLYCVFQVQAGRHTGIQEPEELPYVLFHAFAIWLPTPP